MAGINSILEKKLDSTQNIIWRIGSFYQTLKDCRENLSEEILETKSKYGFFKVIEFGLWNSIILELCFLFSKSDKNDQYCFKKTINYCKSNHLKIKWKSSISLKDLDNLQTKIDSEANLISKIIDIRNEYVAHKGNPNFKITLKDIDKLLVLAISIYNQVRFAFNNTQVHFELVMNRSSASSVIYNLNKYENIRHLAYEQYKKMDSCIETEKIIKIIRSR